MAASEGLAGLHAEVQELLNAVDMDGNQTLDYREFLAASMEKVCAIATCLTLLLRGNIAIRTNTSYVVPARHVTFHLRVLKQ